jgi:hypothetical protein
MAAFRSGFDYLGRTSVRPVIPVEYGSAPGTLGDIILVDPGEYLLTEKRWHSDGAKFAHQVPYR